MVQANFQNLIEVDENIFWAGIKKSEQNHHRLDYQDNFILWEKIEDVIGIITKENSYYLHKKYMQN